MKRAMFPGSFDPIHYGHMQIVERALKIFDEVYIAVLVNFEKERAGNILLSIHERVKIIRESYKDNPRVKVVHSHRLNAIDLFYKCKCDAIVRGMRDENDFLPEERFCKMIDELSNGQIEVIHLITIPHFNRTISRFEPWVISSSYIKNRIDARENIRALFTDIVVDYLQHKFHYDIKNTDG